MWVPACCYSPRAGTVAAGDLVDDVPLSEKSMRLNRIEQLQEKIATEINAKLSGETVEVLVEDKVKGKWCGRTRSGKLVFFKHDTNCLGRLVKIKITKTSPWSLQGEIED